MYSAFDAFVVFGNLLRPRVVGRKAFQIMAAVRPPTANFCAHPETPGGRYRRERYLSKRLSKLLRVVGSCFTFQIWVPWMLKSFPGQSISYRSFTFSLDR